MKNCSLVFFTALFVFSFSNISAAELGLSSADSQTSVSPSLPQNEIQTLLGIAMKNLTVITPAVPKFEIMQPKLDELTRLTFKLLLEEKFQDHLAFNFVYCVLSSSAGAVEQYKTEILKNFANFQFNSHDSDFISRWISTGLKPQDPFKGSSFLKYGETPAEAFDYALSIVNALPTVFPEKKKLGRAMAFTKQMILGDNPGCNANDPGCVWHSNAGLIEYVNKLLRQDKAFILNSLRFYGRLATFQASHPHAGDFTFSDKSPAIDMWPFVLEAVNGDPYEAIRVLMIFNHDQCCTDLPSDGELGVFMSLLNKISPTGNFHGDFPESVLQFSGALGGTIVPQKFIKRFEALSKRSGKTYRIGYYHVYGGLFTAGELLRAGFGKIDGVKFSSFISEALGYYYKKFTMKLWLSDDAQILWHQIKENEHTRAKKPDDWDAARFDKAKLNLDEMLAYLDYTADQHRLGANFAYKVFTQQK